MDNATVNDVMAAEFEQELIKVLPELEWEANDERLRYCNTQILILFSCPKELLFC